MTLTPSSPSLQSPDATVSAAATSGSASHVVHTLSAKVVVADLATAAAVGCSAGIPISIIDYAIMAKVAGVVPSMNRQVLEGLKTLVTRPQRFIFSAPNNHYAKVFRACFAVYGGTYASGNLARSYYEAHGDSSAAVAWKCGIVTSVVNTALSIWKDSFILRSLPQGLAGKGGGSYVPMLSRLGFATRDTLTCVAAFTVVPLLAEYIAATQPGWTESRAKTVAQLVTPCAMQLVTTTVHLPAITYQRTYPNTTWADVMQTLKVDYVGALRLRVVRIFCSFGAAGLLNYSLRPALIERFDPHAFDVVSVRSA